MAVSWYGQQKMGLLQLDICIYFINLIPEQMIYFKYNVSFKKVGSLERLLETQKIERIDDEQGFNKLIRKGDDVYCFISPYGLEIRGEVVLSWGTTEEEALDSFFNSQAEV
jgi:hypothetical protein